MRTSKQAVNLLPIEHPYKIKGPNWMDGFDQQGHQFSTSDKKFKNPNPKHHNFNLYNIKTVQTVPISVKTRFSLSFSFGLPSSVIES
jgi:hypothetical protein